MKPNSDKNTEPKTGEVWWVNNLVFDDGSGKKSRPAVVISSDGDTVTVRLCTSKQDGFKERVELLDPIYAGLDDRHSYVLCEIETLQREKLVRRMGKLCEEDMDNLNIQ